MEVHVQREEVRLTNVIIIIIYYIHPFIILTFTRFLNSQNVVVELVKPFLSVHIFGGKEATSAPCPYMVISSSGAI